jgi:hypothetical protein
MARVGGEMMDFILQKPMTVFFIIAGAMVLRVVWAQIQWNRAQERERIIALFGECGDDVERLRKMGV